jgi:hypothetical protein
MSSVADTALESFCLCHHIDGEDLETLKRIVAQARRESLSTEHKQDVLKQVGENQRYKVTYYREFEQWHEKAKPEILDSLLGHLVGTFVQFVQSPVEYDAEADRLAHICCEALNKEEEKK